MTGLGAAFIFGIAIIYVVSTRPPPPAPTAAEANDTPSSTQRATQTATVPAPSRAATASPAPPAPKVPRQEQPLPTSPVVEAEPSQIISRETAPAVIPQPTIQTPVVAVQPPQAAPLPQAAPAVATDVPLSPSESLTQEARVPNWSIPRTATRANYAEELPLLEGSFDIPTAVATLPYVTCYYAVPMAGKVPAPTAPDIVLRFGWIGQQALPNGDARTLATKHGFTVITIKWPRQEGISLDDTERFSIYAKSGSSDAWNTAIRCVRQIARLPERKVFVVGFSAGASAAQQYTEANINTVEAQVIISGRTYTKECRFSRPSLIMHSYEDCPQQNLDLIEGLKKSKSFVTHLMYAPGWTSRGKNDLWEHNGDGRAWNFAFEWLSGIAELRYRGNGTVPPPSKWMEVGGTPVPSERCSGPLRAFPQPPVVTKDKLTGRPLILADPSLNSSDKVEAKGTVIWIDRRVVAAHDDILAPSQLLAANGYRCMASISDNDAVSCAATFRQLMQLGKISKPCTVVLVEPVTSDIEIFRDFGSLVSGLAIIRPKKSQLMPILFAASKLNLDIVIQAPLISIDAFPAELRGSKQIKLLENKKIEEIGDRYGWDFETAIATFKP